MEKLDKAKSYCFFRLPNNCDLPFLLRIEEEKGFLTEVKAVSFDKSLEDKYLEDYQPLTSLLSSACEQFTEYFTGNRRKFELPISFASATGFRRKVWNELIKIPFGSTVTYGDIAESIGNSKAYRAVGGLFITTRF
ncbi:MAG: MGMT family protein [Culturomica sp.]|jgi:methylated-DNA-[protein]-cysteine S-methyltransferase|nr:MGMT family protein [Culturomica sp.]